MLSFDIITIFPEIFGPYLKTSILGRARERRFIKVNLINLRRFGLGRRQTLDDKPFGGGAGMVMKAEPILRAVAAAKKKSKNKKQKIVLLSAKGKPFNQKIAYTWSRKYKNIIFISGRYEGIDERVKIALKAEEISVGPYVLTDGDIAAMVIISALTRLIPGVIKLESLEEESHWNLRVQEEEQGQLEYPHYTRPEIIKYKNKKYRVPKVLLSGDHKKIKDWRKKH